MLIFGHRRRKSHREWVQRDEAGEMEKTRVGWRCMEHGWAFWVREIKFSEYGEESEESAGSEN
jgi:hypothetical protein